MITDELLQNEICELCPRRCKVNRKEAAGFCGVTESRIARAALHMWEEPPISGKNGSGAIFFCGCNLRCVYCQNSEISTNAPAGVSVTVDSLAERMLKLQEQRANNINLVTPTPHIYLIIEAVRLARKNGLKIPIVYNTNSYMSVSAVKLLEGTVDIYIPDLKYFSPENSKLYSGVDNYFEFASMAIREMLSQCGELKTDSKGLAKSGVIIRHLVLPNNIDETRRVLSYISQVYGKNTFVSLMSQYFPTHNARYPIDRRLLPKEYKRAYEYCLSVGLENTFIQKLTSASADFVPEWERQQKNNE